MAGQLKLRRGTTSQLANFIGSEGELTYDTALKSLVLHDGVTLGGVKIPYLSNDLVPSTMLPTATELVVGASKIATTAIAQAGTNDTDIITALKLKQSFTSLHGDTGWERLPDGLIIQWGLAATGATTPFPIAFPTACYQVAVSYSSSSGGGMTFANQSITATRTGVSMYNVGGVPNSYIAIGR